MQSVDLSLARRAQTPQDFFSDLSEQCRALDILQQDVYGDFNADLSSSWLRKFESELADYFGKGNAVFIPSGVMAQNIVLSLTCKSRPAPAPFMCHFSSHLLLHEQSAYLELLGLSVIIMQQDKDAINQKPVTYKSFIAALNAAGDHIPAACLIECPHREIGGKCTPLQDLILISKHCRENGIHLHMDGARLWEASVAYAEEVAKVEPSQHPMHFLCGLFDSIYASFYKGLGAITGAMLLGDASFIDNSRIWLRRFGGNLYSQMPYAVSCWAMFRENKDSFSDRTSKLREVVAHLTKLFIPAAQPSGSILEQAPPLLRFDPPVPSVSLVHIYLNTSIEAAQKAHSRAEVITGIKCFSRIKPAQFGAAAAAGQCYIELNMGPDNMKICTSIWEHGWSTFLQQLRLELG